MSQYLLSGFNKATCRLWQVGTTNNGRDKDSERIWITTYSYVLYPRPELYTITYLSLKAVMFTIRLHQLFHHPHRFIRFCYLSYIIDSLECSKKYAKRTFQEYGSF